METQTETQSVSVDICDHCGEETQSPLHAVSCGHRDDEERLFRCTEPDCDKPFKTRKHLANHIYRAHSPIIECTIPNCGAQLREITLKKHMERVHNKPPEICKNCGKDFTNLTRHVQRCKKFRPYKCTKLNCKLKFETPVALSHHVSSVHDEPTVKCSYPDCNVTLKLGQMLEHEKRVHETPRIECTYCGQEVISKALSAHLYKCTSDVSRKFVCNEEGCGASFQTASRLAAHARRVHVEMVECPFKNCGAKVKKYYYRYHWERFHNTHNNKQKCTNCDEEVPYESLHSHSANCKGGATRNFPCTEKNCNSAFKIKKELTRHIANVHCQPISCLLFSCDVVLKRHALPKHVQTVHKEIDDKCRKCQKELTNDNWRDHLKTCTKVLRIKQSPRK